jgi:hypothetical protein
MEEEEEVEQEREKAKEKAREKAREEEVEQEREQAREKAKEKAREKARKKVKKRVEELVGLFRHIGEKGVCQGAHQTRPHGVGVSCPREEQLEQSSLLILDGVMRQKLLDVGLIQLNLKRIVSIRECVLG